MNVVIDMDVSIFDLTLEELVQQEVYTVSKRAEKITDAPQTV